MRRFMAILVATVLAAVAAPSAEAAGPACPSSHSSYYAGGRSATSSAIYGASARIEFNNPDLCGTDSSSNGSSGPWAMIASPATVSFPRVGWAQVGYQQTGSSSGFYDQTGLYVFAQYSKKCRASGSCGDASDHTTKFWVQPTGSWEYEVVQYSDGVVHMHANDHHVLQTNYNVAGDWSPAWQAQYFGETRETQSDQVGTSSDPTSFNRLMKYDASGTASFFLSIPPEVDYSSHYHSTSYTPSEGGEGLRIWTNPLTR